MPVIHTHVSVSTTPEQREALKSAYGKAIRAVPGKSERWLMCPFEDNMPIYFAGDNTKPAAYVEVNVFGSSVPGSAWEKLTEQIMAALERELGIPQDRTYIRYTATTDWGWNGGNF
ncbi:phenylpyruvate tautomerase MIF-related protein [Gardnerella vaginalis]|uniref:phenylpyruvate tautomerase MIF-related protein n=1 Tax=Gardnerella vaginalis TaxID=2702 RepID=UPI0039F0A816